MSKIELYFDDEDQYDALKKSGWVIKEEKVSYNQNVYHNQVETVEFDAYVIYDKTGTRKLNYTWGMSDDKYSQVNQLFSEILTNKLLDLVGPKTFQASDEN